MGSDVGPKGGDAMSHRRFALRLALTVVAAGLVGGCGDKPPDEVAPSKVVKA